MLSFATDFPVRTGATAADFVSIVQSWILGSPHTAFNAQDVAAIEELGRVSLDKDSESILSLRVLYQGGAACSVRYQKEELGLHWTSLFTFSDNTGLFPVVAIRVFCEATNPSVMVPLAKKPVFTRLILEGLGGGWDDGLEVGEAPHLLKLADLAAATGFITGKGANRLPVVYVSSRFNGRPSVNVNQLAWRLSGMAHVLVEPDRTFSLLLREKVAGQNVFGGSVGIYWPGGDGRRTQFRRGDHYSGGDFVDAIVDEVRMALVNRRPLDRCTFASVQEALSRQEIESFKGRENLAINEYIQAFDDEMEARDLKLADAEREISRLAAEVRRYEARYSTEDGVTLSVGSECDLYSNEISSMVLRILAEYRDSSSGDSRRRDVVKAIIESNVEDQFAAQAKSKIKEVLRGYVKMDPKVKKALEELGFQIDKQGKHPKLIFQGDERYTFTLPSTGGDSQHGGLNAASDLARLLF